MKWIFEYQMKPNEHRSLRTCGASPGRSCSITRAVEEIRVRADISLPVGSFQRRRRLRRLLLRPQVPTG